MLIALDARTVYATQRRGTGKNLIDLYTHLAHVRPDWQTIAYHRILGKTEELLPDKTVTPRMIEMLGDRFEAWQRVRFPMAAWRDRVDVMHCPANTCPSWMPVNTMVTIHDLIPLDNPKGVNPRFLKHFKQSIVTAVKSASWIITPSAYTRDRLVNEFNADARRMTVNPWAPDSLVRPVPETLWQQTLDKYNINRPFALHFGAGDPRKNTQRVIEAWALADRRVQRDCQLLVVGLEENTKLSLQKVVNNLGIRRSVRLHGFAEEKDLPTLLTASQLLVYPSLSEGFGLPILDAWTTGTAVLTSDCTSLPEVAGDAALLVEPTDTCAISRAITRGFRDPAARRDLVAAGRSRLKQYSWQHTAERFAWTVEQAANVARRRIKLAA